MDGPAWLIYYRVNGHSMNNAGQIIWFCLMSSIVHTVFNDFQTCKLEIDVNLQNQADELSPCIFLVLSTVLKLLIEFHVLRKDFDLKNLKQ